MEKACVLVVAGAAVSGTAAGGQVRDLVDLVCCGHDAGGEGGL